MCSLARACCAARPDFERRIDASFSDAVNLRLTTDAEFGRFVDPQVVGSDRKLAIFFMRSMPANKRGDFVYINQGGRVVSNRLGVAFAERATPTRIFPSRVDGKRVLDSRVRHRGAGPSGEPANSCTGGACIRVYSSVGINALYGYAMPPCDMALQSNEAGYMYFNAYNSGGGDVVDAGIGVNLGQSTRYNPSTNPSPNSISFLSIGATGMMWANSTQTYPCGSPVGMMYGTMPSPNQQYSLLMTGVPSFDPTQMNLPPATTTWNPAAWVFFNSSAQLLAPSGMWNGYPSNCTQCSVAAMFTLAQPSLNFDGSCYGYCNPSVGATGAWFELVGGQLINECDAPPVEQQETCTIESTSGWQGGAFFDPNDSGIAYSSPNEQQIAEGINLSYVSSSSRTSWVFRSPLPPAPAAPCTPDGHKLCAIEMSSTIDGQCNTGGVGPHGQPIIVYGQKNVYYIFQKSYVLELLGTATETETVSGPPLCLPTVKWSPGEPSSTFNDPNLP